MRVAIDLDGVCYEFHRTVRYMLNHYLKLDLPDVWDVFDQWWPVGITKEAWDWVWSDGVDKGLFRYGHMTKGCRVGLQAIEDLGHQLVVVTQRPEDAVNDTLDWVRFYFKDITLSGLHILSNGEPKSSIKADILIDDKWENSVDWMSLSPIEENRRALLFDRPYNQQPVLKDAHAGVTRVKGWEGVVEWFEKVA